MFDIHTPVAHGNHANYACRPTVVAIVAVPTSGGDSLFLVQPRNADAHGWIPPQGEINFTETPWNALLRELFEECSWGASLLDEASARPLVEVRTAARSSDGLLYDYRCIAVRMRKWIQPKLNGENRKFALVGGPNYLWGLITGCRTSKQSLILNCLGLAINYHRTGQTMLPPVLLGPRWQKERFSPLIKYISQNSF